MIRFIKCSKIISKLTKNSQTTGKFTCSKFFANETGKKQTNENQIPEDEKIKLEKLKENQKVENLFENDVNEIFKRFAIFFLATTVLYLIEPRVFSLLFDKLRDSKEQMDKKRKEKKEAILTKKEIKKETENNVPEIIESEIEIKKSTPNLETDKPVLSKRELAKIEMIKETNEKILNIFEKNDKIKKIDSLNQINLNSENKNNEIIILAIPVFLTVEAIKIASDFINDYSKIANSPINLFTKIITEVSDFTEIDNFTKTKFLTEENSFKTLAIFNKNLNKFCHFELSDLKYNKNQILKKFQPISSISKKEEFEHLLKKLAKDELILGFCDSNEKEKQIFNEFILENENINLKQIIPVHIPSKNDFYQCKPNEIIAFLKTKKPEKTNQEISNKKFEAIKTEIKSEEDIYNISKNLAELIDESLVYKNHFISGPNKRFRIDFHLDLNTINKVQLERLKEIVKETKKDLQSQSTSFDFNIITKHSKSRDSKISAFDSEYVKNQMKMLYENQNKDEMKRVLLESPQIYSQFSNEYKFQEDEITKESLISFCNDLLNGKATFNFKSQKPGITDFYSRKIVGSEFNRKVILSPYHQAVFYYSHNCGGCKKFLPLFEEIAKENLEKPETNLTFNRIDNERNQSEVHDVYFSTPKIVLYRNDSKEKPFEYRSDKLNKKLLSSFFESTLNFEIIKNSNEVIDNIHNQADLLGKDVWKNLIDLG